MEVIILAGGLGTRLRSEIKNIPKCMAPVNGKPFLWYLLKDLEKYSEIKRVILSVGYLHEIILDWILTIKDKFPFEFDYAIEEEPLGTGGGIRLAMKKVTEEEAIIMNGDTYFNVDFNELIAIHRNQDEAKLTIALKLMKNFDRYGTVAIDKNGRILKFNEKQVCKEGVINGGIYVLSKDDGIFKGQPRKFSFEVDVMQEKCGKTGCLYGVILNGYFIDIGIPEDYHKAKNEFSKLFF